MKNKTRNTGFHLLLAAMALTAASSAHAQSPIVIDNTAPQFAITGTWPTSTSVAGYEGTNYQTHEPNGSPPSALVVDNNDAGFSVTGTWGTSTSVSGYLGSNYRTHEANGAPPSAIVADNSSGTAVGTWPVSTSVGGYLGTNYQVHTAGTGASTFNWPLTIPSSGSYQVYARWTQHPNRATNAKYTVNHASGSTQVTVNQQASGGAFNLLGTFSLTPTSTITLTEQANSLGQRIRKTNTQGDTVYHYDAQGWLIAESNTAGQVQKEYIYLGDIPVAVLQ